MVVHSTVVFYYSILLKIVHLIGMIYHCKHQHSIRTLAQVILTTQRCVPEEVGLVGEVHIAMVTGLVGSLFAGLNEAS